MTSRHHRLVLSLALAGFATLSLDAQTESAPVVPDIAPDPVQAGDIPPALQSPAANTYVDMLVVYTPAARAQAGSTTAMVTAINAYVALANTCYSNSDVAVRMRLVGTAEVSYTESSSSMSTDLSWVAGNSTVATLRNTYGADLVCLVRRGAAGGAAGVGYLGSGSSSFSGYAFCVVADDYADSNITFPHEVGHNFGSNHDRGNAGNPTGGYNFGWRFTGNDAVQYRTVMAYAPGTRIPYFSNPSINYQGVATGVASGQATAADNSLVHETNAAVTAAYRGVADTLIPGDYSGDGTADLILAGVNYQCRLWSMSGATRSSTTDMAYLFTSVWTTFGSGDLDGDGKDDLLFKAADGRIAAWFMNGTTRTSAAVLSSTFLPSVWTPIGTGDIDSDGKADLLFKDPTGRIAVWYMNGTTRTSAAVLGYTFLPNVWTPFGLGDLDGDGKDDLLFKAADGRIAVWFMNGSTRTSASVLPSTFTGIWTPIGAGDFDGDGKDDLVFKSSDNRCALWFMNGTTRTSAGLTSGTLDAY